MNKKILFVIGDLDRGGAETHLSNLLPLLKEHGLIPHVYTLTHKGVLSEIMESKGIFIKEPQFRKQLNKLPPFVSKPLLVTITFFTLCFYIKKIKPDVIHFFLPYAYLLGGFCSLFFSISMRIMSRRSLSAYSKNRPVVRFLERSLHKKMDFLLGNSKAVIKQLKEECNDHGKIKLIYNGVSLERIDKDKYREKLRKELGIPNECVVITMVANIIPYKGHHDMIIAISRMVKIELPEFIVICVGRDNGDGKKLQLFSSQSGAAEKIIWLGERNDVPEILCTSDIGLLCSYQEGFSNSILESMAARLPMVVTNVGGNSEAVSDAVCGYVIPPHDPTCIVTALIKLINSKEDRRRMGVASRKKIEEKFTQEQCVEQYLDLYKLSISSQYH